jgi:hypothetical protein
MNANATQTQAAVARRNVPAAAAGLLLLLAIAIATLLIVQPVDAKSAATIKRAALSGSSTFSAVNGEAKWKAKGGERELEIQIEDAKALSGKRLTVRIGGRLVGHMKVSALGRARLVKSTEAGQSVPTSVTGKAVRVTTGGGTPVASGRF